MPRAVWRRAAMRACRPSGNHDRRSVGLLCSWDALTRCRQNLILHRGQFVPELLFLRLEVAPRRIMRGNLERDPFGDRQPVALDADQLARVVAEQTHRAHAELAEDLHADAVI